MKKLIGIGIAAMMVMGLAGAANAAYLFNLLVQNPTVSTEKGQVQFATNTTAITPYLEPAGPNPQVTGFLNNDPTSTTRLVALKTTTEPDAWYAQVFAAKAWNGTAYVVRVTSSTGSAVLTPGTWFMYKGIGTVVNGYMKSLDPLHPVSLMATGTMKTTESTWATSTFGATFAANDFITMSRYAIPEPGSMVAMLSGLVGLVGFGIRRKK